MPPGQASGYDPVSDQAALRVFLRHHPRLFVLTGAGCSTGSGIPDYRDAAGDWKRKPPIDFQLFMSDAQARRRYWARSMVGWRRFGSAAPNAAHLALARLEAEGRIVLLATQNVDGLHQVAGQRRVVDLHGRLDAVRCMRCAWRAARAVWQQQLEQLNPGCPDLLAAAAPDGDADLEDLDFSAVAVPDCPRCMGLVKPDVVFFGESVPRERIEQADAALAQSDAVLVVGSSLMVYSGYRYVTAAARLGLPVAAVNLGRTRADGMLTIKIEQPCDQVLAALWDKT